MYLSRSQRTKDKNRSSRRKRRRNRLLLINLSLLTMIGALLIYYYIDSRGNSPQIIQQAEPPAAIEDHTNKDNPDDIAAPTEHTKEELPLPAQEDKQQEGQENSGKQDADVENDEQPSPELPEQQENTDSEADAPAQPAEPKIAPETNDDSALQLNFVGDIMFSGKAEEKLLKEGFDYPYKKLGHLFLKDDLTVGNLESPVTTGGIGAADKTYVFKSSPKALEALSAAGMDAVSLANNHILDQGVSGLQDTFKHLQRHNMVYVGAGQNEDEAFEPKIVTRKGVKIALIGVSRVIPETSWYAGSKKPGVAGTYDPTRAVQAIQAASSKADLVVVLAHWGKERTTVLEEHQKTLAHTFVDAGADLVIGAHPHVLQGVEQYKGKWIAYSTGNFIFTRSSNEQTWETAVFQASCTKSGDCTLKLIPYHAELAQPVPMEKEKAYELLKKVESFSSGNVGFRKDGTAYVR